ncbi:glycoside hydrolase family 130 protein [Candidatus Sulfidibacterium hydrothermale]|uniref:glycoside hydrolase family 130 protein n=1 Tax=Candidatus Sulfidibacterium hydrothermale TaxID=2875962 RepID=UPI001F0B0E05|nr:glycoside hydrolase family 130 protein [Candidatus Sulfidibacterium hydrothermale]UBM62870.1 glycoside hydrolase family 130 protein [Candidatus Sulfidibacterium hydrothermale]
MNYAHSKVKIYRQKISFLPDESRVITKLFGLDKVRIYKVIDRVLKLSEKEKGRILEQIISNFEKRHKNVKRIFKDNFDEIIKHLDITIYNELSLENKLLVGAYFTLEYSIESAALFNPSIVPHPFQTPEDMAARRLKVIISFRAVGEGHMSSVVFRSGTLDETGDIEMDELSHLVEKAKIIHSAEYSKQDFIMKLSDMGQYEWVKSIFDDLLDNFTAEELEESIKHFREKGILTPKEEQAIDTLYWILRSNYEIEFHDDSDISERVIFPRSTTDIRAIEDARFVAFSGGNGKYTYYAPYTAYNGITILPQLIETKDFFRFKISTMTGPGSQNKGMALFPEKINGKYAMISRNDNENLYIMYSDSLNYWENPVLIREPKFFWEFIQIGNSGSPIKTPKGWLLLTHGVGPVRTYSLGAILLDLNDPSKVIGELKDPLLVPRETERNGYVPNVVYACGALLHNEWVILPYAASDTRSGIVKFKLNDLLNQLTPVKN